jgi:hypothetical protein
MKKNIFLTNILQSVAIALILGVLGGLWKTYLDVHDLQTKVEWLYSYQFPARGGK